MAKTEIRGDQVKDADIGRADLNVATSGKAVVRKLVQGTGISLSADGADSGTGDVTVSTPAASASVVGHVTTGTQQFAGRKGFDGQYYSDEHDLGNSGAGTVTIDWDNGNCQKITMTGNCTFAAPSNMKAGARYMLKLIEDATGSRVPVWNSAWHFPAATAPTLSGANKVDFIGFYCDGSVCWGASALNYTA